MKSMKDMKGEAEGIEKISGMEVDETPEMLAALDAGRRAIREGKVTRVEEARELIAKWAAKSPER